MGGLDEEPQGSPVRLSGTSTHLVPPTRLTSGVRLRQPNTNEVIMTTPSKVTSPRRTRKTKSAAQPKPQTVYPLSRYELEHRTRVKDLRELNEFIDTLTKEEMRVVGKVKPYGDPVNGLKEIRRLLGESIAQCKIIPFPVGGKRGVQIAKEA